MALTYKQTGVDYDILDTVKRLAQIEAFTTRSNIKIKDFNDIEASRGESAYVIEADDCYFAMVSEGLGTKSLVADEMRKITGKTYYDSIAQDTVAMIINDLITVGAQPISILAYWAVGDSSWFADKKRSQDLVSGWKKACDFAGVSWGGGETPSLSGIVNPSTIDLAGSAWGIVSPKNRLVLGDNLSAGDAIILFESSGIHANGLTLARKLVTKLPNGYATKLPEGTMYGEELLKPTIIYSRLVQDMLCSGIDIHYMVNITGHGWRKLMRAKKILRYLIDKIPSVPAIFPFIQKNSGLSDCEMYATFNMGAGFAIFVAEKDTEKVLDFGKKHKIKAWLVGRVQKGQKEVIIRPLDIIFKGEELQIR